jgi:hypothetical protein
MILELHSDDKATVLQRLAVNHVSTGRIFVPRSNLYRIAKLPGANGVDPSAALTDVIGVRTLFSIRARTLRLCEAYHDDDGEPPFPSAIERVVQRHFAETSTGHTWGVVAL